MVTVQDILQLFETQGLRFPDLSTHPSGAAIVAGGSIANAILTLTDGKEYPINDFDLFVLNNTPYVKVRDKDEKRKVLENDAEPYPDFREVALFLTGRLVHEDTDIITMQPSYLIDNHSFPNDVLDSFDLNCVQAGIYMNENAELQLLVTTEFNEFLKHRVVEIVNVHSVVTLCRLMSKSRQLGAYLYLGKEAEIMRRASNFSKLNELAPQQIEKYKDEAEFVEAHLKPRLLETPDDLYYHMFLSSPVQAKRQLKITILRALYDNDASLNDRVYRIISPHKEIPRFHLLSLYHLSRHLTFGEWLGTKNYHDEEIQAAENLIAVHPFLKKLFVGLTFAQVMRRIAGVNRFIEQHGVQVLHALDGILLQTKGQVTNLERLFYQTKVVNKVLDLVCVDDVFATSKYDSDSIKTALEICKLVPANEADIDTDALIKYVVKYYVLNSVVPETKMASRQLNVFVK